ncbi:MAG: putative TetR-family transcriptional regulator, partial [Candidatus Eremiobacteraeota bacterium]|nr:putative TetR-family transcriptional regulator [Candidatus Eremiobacteraeota bacterium]
RRSEGGRSSIKRATLTTALARALQQRGVPEPAASLAAEMGLAVFHVGFGCWFDDPSGRELVEIVHDGFDQLKGVASGT